MWWFAPALFAITSALATSSVSITGYPVSDVAGASLALSVCGPLTGMFGALQFRGFAAAIETLRSFRPGILVLWKTWWPLLLGCPTAVCCGILVVAGVMPSSAQVALLVLLDFVIILACALLGIALSAATPPVFAVPAVGCLLWIWLAVTPATTSGLLHTVNGSFAGCCTSSQQPSSLALTAGLVFFGLVVVGVSSMFLSRTWPRSTGVERVCEILVAVGFAFGVAAGGTIASGRPLSLQATQERTTDPVCRERHHTQFCVWPENRAELEQLAAVTDALNGRLQANQLPLIRSVSESPAVADSLAVDLAQSTERIHLAYSLGAAYVDFQTGCRGLVGEWRNERVALVALLAGGSADSLRSTVGDRALAVATDRLGEADDDWFLSRSPNECWSPR